MTTYNLTLESGMVTSSDTFARRYTLTILTETDKGTVVNLKAIDITPSGHPQGGSEVRLLQNTLVKFKETAVNKNIAKLALKFDPELNKIRSYDKGITIIKSQLEAKSKEKVKVIEI
jgi:hypothetical protein